LDEIVWQNVDLDQIVLNLSDMSIDVPVECKSDFCYEESSVVVKVKKIWKPLTTIVNSDSLKSWEFAKEFSNLAEDQTIDNKSPVYDRVVLQKILYDRWLLWTKPTGKIWYLTELAVMKLQCIKWFSEYNSSKSIFEIWHKTIVELNKLKERMKNPDYLSDSKLPEIELSICGKDFISRYNTINSLLKNPPTWANNTYSNMIVPDTSIKWEGEVIIKKTQ